MVKMILIPFWIVRARQFCSKNLTSYTKIQVFRSKSIPLPPPTKGLVLIRSIRPLGRNHRLNRFEAFKNNARECNQIP